MPLSLSRYRWSAALVLLAAAGSLPAAPPGLCLVPTGPDLSEKIDPVLTALNEGKLDQADKLLDSLVQADPPGLYDSGDGRWFLPFAQSLARRLAASGPAGLELIERRMRTGPDAAEQIVRDLVARGDRASLNGLRRQFPYTRVSRAAMDATARLDFDAGRFLAAAGAMARLDRFEPRSDQAPIRLAIQAVAWHRGGCPDQARQVRDRLARRFAQARGQWARRRQNLVQAVEAQLQVDPGPPDSREDHPTPALAGNWADARVAWRIGPDPQHQPIQLRRLAAARPIAHAYPHRKHVPHQARIQNGRVVVHHKAFGSRPKQAVKAPPPLIEALVADGKAWVRTDEAVLAIDADGKVAKAPLPIRRNAGRRDFGVAFLTDEGHYRLTGAANRIYALADFLPVRMLQPNRRPGQNNPTPPDWINTSRLVALDDRMQTVWSVGYKQQLDQPETAAVKFISLPAEHEGKLYVLSMQPNTGLLSLICLSAETGQFVWATAIQQAPAGSYTSPARRYTFDAGSRPLVADGRVFVMTNAGLVAAVDAKTGLALWARQYPSLLIRQTRGRRRVDARAGKAKPINDLQAGEGLLWALPADSPALLALSAEDGRVVWRQDRQQADLLSPLPGARLLLTGPGAQVLDGRSGRQIARVEDLGCYGRPLVMARRVLISSPARNAVLQLDVKDWTVSPLFALPEGGYLGNLTWTGTDILATNPAGVTCLRPGGDPAEQTGQGE